MVEEDRIKFVINLKSKIFDIILGSHKNYCIKNSKIQVHFLGNLGEKNPLFLLLFQFEAKAVDFSFWAGSSLFS